MPVTAHLTRRAASPPAPSSAAKRRNLAQVIDSNGGRHGAAIVTEARRARLPLPLACALVEQESSFRNVYGHDAVPNPIPKGSAVTRASYLRYRAWRDAGLGNQGVGLTQLTWGPYQDRADRLGGCWSIHNQLRVGFQVLADGIRAHGTRGALSAYNAGSPQSPAGLRYAASVLRRRDRWARVLGAAAPVAQPTAGRPESRTLRTGHRGSDVELLQRTLNRYYQRYGAPRLLDVDRHFGAKTELAYRRVRAVLGLTLRRDANGRVLISPRDRIVLRHPDRRTAEERARAADRGRTAERRLRALFRKQREEVGDRPKVIRLPLDFNEGQLGTNTAIHTTVGHHSASRADRSDQDAVELCKQWHQMHKNVNGWAGIGYHACFTRNGTIILLRPGWAKGAGVENHNTGTYHVLFNGDFRRDRPTKAQIRSYRWFVRHGHEIAGVPRQGARRLGHRDFSGHESNVCPGPNLHPYVKGS